MAARFDYYGKVLPIIERHIKGQMVRILVPRAIDVRALANAGELEILLAAKGWFFVCEDGFRPELTFEEFYAVAKQLHSIHQRTADTIQILREKHLYECSNVKMKFRGNSKEIDTKKLPAYLSISRSIILPPTQGPTWAEIKEDAE